MKKSTLSIIILILVIALGLYLFFFHKPAPATPSTASQAISYTCDDGKTISATFGSSTAAIVLSDGRTFTLPQVVSGSGAKYEQGANTNTDIVFWTEGDNAFITENDTTTYTNCIAGVTQTQGSSASFTDQGKTFTFTYPTQFTVSGGGVGYTQSWMQNTQTSGIILAKLTIPSKFEPNTNFGDALFTVGTSADPQAIADCLTAPGGEGATTSPVTIQGTQFTKVTYTGVGAGNIYDTTSYRVVRNDQCYAVEYTIHSANIGNYSPDQGISAFDEGKVQSVLEGMVQSFTFLQ